MAEPNSKRGGHRPGAGRKKTTPPIAKPKDKSVAAAVLEEVDEFTRWVNVIRATAPESLQQFAAVNKQGVITPLSGRDAAALLAIHTNSIRFLHEQVNGKAKQAVEMSGSLVFETLAERLAKARQRKNAGE